MSSPQTALTAARSAVGTLPRRVIRWTVRGGTMATDVNQCDCGWSEVGDNVNPHRKKCPNCGAPFVHSETIRWFGR